MIKLSVSILYLIFLSQSVAAVPKVFGVFEDMFTIAKLLANEKDFKLSSIAFIINRYEGLISNDLFFYPVNFGQDKAVKINIKDTAAIKGYSKTKGLFTNIK